MIQVIEIQSNKYTLNIYGIKCIFIPMQLFTSDSFLPLTAFVPKNKSVIKWKVKGKEVSYNQIKKAINGNKTTIPYIQITR